MIFQFIVAITIDYPPRLDFLFSAAVASLAWGDPNVCRRDILVASASIVGAVKRSATASWTRNFLRIALMSWRERRR